MSSSSEIPQNLLIAGGTGWLGSLSVEEILKKKDSFNQIKVLVRKSTKESKKDLLEKWVQQGAILVEGELDHEESLLKALQGVDTVISFVGGATVFGGEEIKLIQAAKKAGSVKRFVPSEFGVDSFEAEQDPVFQAKIDSRKAIKEAGLDYTFIFTGMFYEYFFTPLAGFDVKAGKVTVAGDGTKKVSVISIKDIARYLPEILLDPKSKNATVKIAGEVLSQNAAIKIVEQLTGKKLEVEHISLEQHRKTIETSQDFLPRLNAQIAILQLTTEAGHANDGAKYSNIIPQSVAEFVKSQFSSD